MADPTIYIVPNPGDPKSQNTVWFEHKEEKNEAESEAQGFPVFDVLLLAHIMGPGNMRSEAVKIVERKKPDGKVIESHGEYANQVAAFKKGEAGDLTGTPLTELAILDHGVRASLKAMGIHSVESLAAISETAAPGLLGFRKFKTAAQAFLDQRAGQQPLAKLAEDLEAERTKYATLEQNFNDLLARVKELEADKPAKGRKAA